MRARDDLILEGVLTDAGERAADLLDEAVAEAGFARFVVVLRAGDVGEERPRTLDLTRVASRHDRERARARGGRSAKRSP